MEQLKKMWKRQKSFTDKVNKKPESIKEQEFLTKDICLALMVETTEVLNLINWKTHRKSIKIIDRDMIKEEMIDCWKYLLTMLQIWQITPKEFIEEFNKKSLIVEQRLINESKLTKNKRFIKNKNLNKILKKDG